MYAKVMNENGVVYYSPVLLLKSSGLFSWAVVFDETLSKLVKIPYWYRKQNVHRPNILIFDQDLKGYKNIKDGLKSIWENKSDLFRCNIGRFTDEQTEYAKQFIRNEEFRQFIEINNNEDLKVLCECAGYFHDGYLLQVKKTERYEEFFFNTDWGSYIAIRVSGKTDNHIAFYELIDDSETTIADGKKRIVFFNMSYLTDKKLEMHIAAQNMSYNSLFEKKIIVKELNSFEIKDNSVMINAKKQYLFNIMDNLIVMPDDDEGFLSIFFRTDQIVYKLIIKNRTKMIDELINKVKNNGYKVDEIVFDTDNINDYISVNE